MKISGGFAEDGIIAGNAYDKYGSTNPIVKRLMAGFFRSLDELVTIAAPRTVHEVGCGEGYWVMRWLERGLEARGSDFSSKIIELARENAREQGLSPDVFSQRSIYTLSEDTDSADLIVCCEVLEHLEKPEAGLQALSKVARRYSILSVPREPLWRLMNLARGKYVASLGNTPGHLQNWSRSGFIRLVGDYFEIEEVRTPLPWTMLLCRTPE